MTTYIYIYSYHDTTMVSRELVYKLMKGLYYQQRETANPKGALLDYVARGH